MMNQDIGSVREKRAAGANRVPAADRSRAVPGEAGCADCALREACLPAALTGHPARYINAPVAARLRLRPDQALHRAGDPLLAIYVVRSGSFKSQLIEEDGREQVSGVHLCGDLLGLEAIASGRHTRDAIALEASEVCAIPFATLERLMVQVPAAQRWFHKALGRALVSDRATIVMLGCGRADERFAAFLLGLSRRLAAKGFSPRDICLSLSRGDMASYLGLSKETVSRVLSRCQRQGFISVRKQRIELLDVVGLKRAAGSLEGS